MTHRRFGLTVLLAVCLAFVAPSLSGQASVYAPGCDGAITAPQLSWSGSFTPDYIAGLHMTGAPSNAFVVLVVGTDDSFSATLDHIAGMAPGCTLNTNDLIVLQFNADPNGDVDLFFPVPGNIGPLLCFQFAVVSVDAPLELVMSEALRVPLEMTLNPDMGAMGFGHQIELTSSEPMVVTLNNDSESDLTLDDVALSGFDAPAFSAVLAEGPGPILVPAGGSTQVEVTFTPSHLGPHRADLTLVHLNPPQFVSDPVVSLRGTGIGPPGQDLRVTAGQSNDYVDNQGDTWAADYGSTSGSQQISLDPAPGTLDPILYRTYRKAPLISYEHELPNGTYDVTLYFLEPDATSVGARTIDVQAEGVLVLDDLDIFALVGADMPHSESFGVTVSDGVLSLLLQGTGDDAVVSAISASLQFAGLDLTPAGAHAFGSILPGADDQLALTLDNPGTIGLQLSAIDLVVDAGDGTPFTLDLDGTQYVGSSGTVSLPSTFLLPAGGSAPAILTFAPSASGFYDIDLVFHGNFPGATMDVTGVGAGPTHPYLHTLIAPVADSVDWNGTGIDVTLDGSASTTYEPGHALTSHTWTEGPTTLASTDVAVVNLPVGTHTVTLTIADDNAPAEVDAADVDFEIHPATAVPGVSARYFDTGPTAPATLLDSPPAQPDYVESLAGFLVADTGSIGGSPFVANTLVRLFATVGITSADTYGLAVVGGVDHRLFVDGAPYVGPLALGVGPHTVEALIAVDSLVDLPLDVHLAVDPAPPAPVDPASLSFDATLDPPLILAMTAEGLVSGGEPVVLDGAGFFPASGVTVHWGGVDLTEFDFTSISETQIAFVSPVAAAGPIDVTVETPSGTSNQRTFAYGQLGSTPDLLFAGFGATRIGETSDSVVLTLTNDSVGPVTIQDAIVFDADATDFAAFFQDSLPIVLNPAESTLLDVVFAPTMNGPRTAQLQVVHADLLPSAVDPVLPLDGIALGPPGQEILLAAGAEGLFMDSQFRLWSRDYGATAGTTATTADPISGTADEGLYQEWREGASFDYLLELPNGQYDVTLHFAEVSATGIGERVFDVDAEGVSVLDDLDLFAVAGHDVAHTETFTVGVSDGFLDLSFDGETGAALLAALEVSLLFAELDIQPTLAHDFGQVLINASDSIALTFTNAGTLPLNLSSVEIDIQLGVAHDFELDLDGTIYQGDHDDVTLPAAHVLAPGASVPATMTYTVSEHGPQEVDYIFHGDFADVVFTAQGIGLIGADPFLHVVIEPIPTAVDYDGDGFEDILLDGSFSHTHEPGQNLDSWEWTEGLSTLSFNEIDTLSFPVGTHEVCLEIGDDDDPEAYLIDCLEFDVVPPSAVPGISARYYATDPTPPETLLDSPPPTHDWGETLGQLRVDEIGGGVGGSALDDDVLIRLQGDLLIDVTDDYVFTLTGGVDDRLYIDGTPYVSGPLNLTAGSHTIEARFAMDELSDLPVEVSMAPDGSPPEVITEESLTHDQTSDPPFINSMPDEGSTLGGNTITIAGTGFFPASSVTVHWGATDLTELDFTNITANSIEFLSPVHSAGVIAVSVQTPQGTSNGRTFTYTEAGPPPIVFTLAGTEGFHPNKPTAAAWGPDGRLYVGTRTGRVIELELAEDYSDALNEIHHDGVNGLSNEEILGIAVNPFDPPSPVKLYVAHSELYAQDGDPPTGFFSYNGQVSVLTGPDFDSPVPLITGLPVSNHDHGINGMLFDNNGDLLIAVGGNTNAGVAHPNLGDLPETPLSAAIIKAETSKVGFNGIITYSETIGGAPNQDQRDGEIVDIDPGVDVSVHGHGLRNPFDMAYTTDGRLYSTDNGPNGGFGLASTGPASTDGDASDPDELIFIEADGYYGSANRNRGRTDARQYVYHDASAPSVPGEFDQAMLLLSSSTNGLVEYRATTFGGQMRGDLIAQRWKGYARRIQLSPDGRSVVASEELSPRTDGLGLITGPGGAIISVKYQGHQIDTMVPQDASAVGVTAFDIHPWRAPATGGAKFVIGGVNFDTLGTTSVTIGGIPAVLDNVTSGRIMGTIPAQASPTVDLLDVVVTSGLEQSTIPGAFRYLFVPAGNEPGRWESNASAPIDIGEVAGGVVKGKLYLVGEGEQNTLVYDIVTGQWDENVASVRPYEGTHHAAEVWDGKLYLIGGIGDDSEGRVQIYDPNLDQWSLGEEMPWEAGSCSTALIGDKIYVAGGIVNNSFTTDECAVYDPALDSWTSLADMPDARNHAAAGTDGSRLWVFGGRGPGSGDSNTLANGFDDVQVYDPVSDSWESSDDPGSSLVPLPIGRGGMGKAVFYKQEFYVMGGETLDGPGANAFGTYDRVDVYEIETDSWRTESDLPTPRHGFFPMLVGSRIFVACGGTESGNSQSATLEVFTRQ